MLKDKACPFAVYAYTPKELHVSRHPTRKSARHYAKRIAGKAGFFRILLADADGVQSLLWEA